MYQTFSSARPMAAESRPNLLMRICGQPPLFSPEQQLMNWLTAVWTVLIILFTTENAIIGVPLVSTNIVGVLFYGALYFFGRFRRTPVTKLAHINFAASMLLTTLTWLANNGIDGSTFFIYLVILLVIMGVLHGRARLIWMGIWFAHVAAMIVVEQTHPEWLTPYASPAAQRFDITFTFFCIAIFMIGYAAVSMYNLEERRKVADALLLNILPAAVTDKLKYSSQRVIAEHHPEASILFADIVSFTPLSAGLTPTELVELLNAVFSYFDTLTDKYGLEKIKTIGDCYMVAAGVPTERTDHAQVLTRMALEMRDYVCAHDFAGKRLSLRIGINSGAVVAGVIGYRKFAYDLWGDTVNTASRMESHGQADVIQVTESTYVRIRDGFVCEPRGSIEVKGKGPMNVWHVAGAKG